MGRQRTDAGYGDAEIVAAYARAGGDPELAAMALGMSRRTFDRVVLRRGLKRRIVSVGKRHGRGRGRPRRAA